MTEFKGRLRIAGKDVDGNLTVPKALKLIKGVGTNLADSVAKAFSAKTNIALSEKVGNLTEEQIKLIEKILSKPTEYGIPSYMVNRARDPETGETVHLIGSDLNFTIKQDKERHMAMKSWKGVRYALGLPVRGQRTRTMGRKGKTVGVQRKKK